MGAVRRFPRKKMPWTSPCQPASKHKFVEVQRQFASEKGGEYIILSRCDLCGNSLYVQTKPYSRKILTNQKMKKWPITKRWWLPYPAYYYLLKPGLSASLFEAQYKNITQG